LPTDISNTYNIPENVYALLKNACYDCHSNNTIYPWYANIQPMVWLIKSDIDSGKAKLNFSEFGSYSSRRRISKLRDVENRIRDDKMPLPSYRRMHKSAQLSQQDKDVLVNWIEKQITE